MLLRQRAARSGQISELISRERPVPKSVVVAKTTDIKPGSCLTVEVHGITAVLFNVEGILYALDNTCPHAGGPLGEGNFAGEVIQCPWHRWRYNVRTGEKLGNPEFKVDRYDVQTHGEEVCLILPIPDEHPPASPPLA